MSAQVCDGQGIGSGGDQDTLVWWWEMAREPRTLRSQLESLSWLERSPSPETQILASRPSLQGTLPFAFHCSDESWECYTAGKISLQGWKCTVELSDPCESQTQESVATRWKGDRANLEKQTGRVSVFHFLEAPYPYTHYPTTVWWLAEPERKRSISSGGQSQTGKYNTVPLLSSASLIYFCCDAIPFTFHFTQQEGAYAILMRSWALLHGLFLGTINQCISLHCRLFFPTSLWTVQVAHGCSFRWVPRHTLLFGHKTPCFSAMCFGSEEPEIVLSWIPPVPDAFSCQKSM